VAAAAFISDPAGRLLFVRRAKEPSAGKLGVPGGFIDMGESAEEGVRREVREEVALEIDRLTFLASFPNDYKYRGVVYPVVDLYFTAMTRDPDSAHPLDGVARIEWHEPSSLGPSEIAFPSLLAALSVWDQTPR
jgi:ADP-ribose pyrophosphatase YjhB (NUDIX family)